MVKLARVADNYRHLSKVNYPITLNAATFAYRTQSGVQRVTLNLAQGVSVVTGGNGAGKTTLLKGMYASLAAANQRSEEWPTWLTEVRMTGSTSVEDWSVLLRREIEPDFLVTAACEGEYPTEVHYIDAARETEDLLRTFEGDSNLQDLTDGVDPAPMSPDWLEHLAFVLSRSYEEVLVYENASLREDDDAVPLFRATSYGSKYSTTQMGRGEVAACYLLWKLSRVPRGAIVFLEEPESHLAAFSQGALMDLLVHISVNHQMTFVISSHSPEMFSRLPDKRIAFVRAIPYLLIRNGQAADVVAKDMGLAPRVRATVLVEDAAAKRFLVGVARVVDPMLLDVVEVIGATSGESGVVRVLDEVKNDQNVVAAKFVGILDGDMRERVPLRDDLLHLPSDVGPEALLRSHARRWYADASRPLVEHLRDPDRLAHALDKVDGADEHDWLLSLSKELGGIDFTVEQLILIAMADAAFVKEINELIASVRQRVMGS